MTIGRLLSSRTLDSTNKVLVANHSVGGTTTITLAEQRWWPGHETGELYTQIEIALNAAFPGTWNVSTNGVNFTDSTRAQGQLVVSWTGGGTFRWVLTNPAWTLDPRLLGFRELTPAEEVLATSATGVLMSQDVHRAGWYPRIGVVEDRISQIARTMVAYSSGDYLDLQTWGERQVIVAGFDIVQSALVRIDAAADPARAAQVFVTTGDLNCAFERFVLDLISNSAEGWRLYPDQTVGTTYRGPYRFKPASPLWTNPLAAPSRMISAAGDIHAIVIDGIEARGGGF